MIYSFVYLPVFSQQTQTGNYQGGNNYNDYNHTNNHDDNNYGGSCNYKVVLESRTVADGKTTFIWSVQNTKPGNGLYGTTQDLSHWGIVLNNCIHLSDVVSAAVSNNGTGWNSNTSSCEQDKSQSCVTVPVLKFDLGTTGSSKSYYKLVLNGIYGQSTSFAYFKSGSKTGCCTDTITGVGCHTCPGPTIQNDTICGPGSVTLTATGSGTIKWFSDQGCLHLVGTGPTFTTPVLTTTTTYYAISVGQHCNQFCNFTVTKVVVTVNPLPDAPSVTGATRCGRGSVTLKASGCDSGTLRWYKTDTSATPIATGPSFTTPSLVSTTTYYVSCKKGDCEGPRTPVTATINNIIGKTVGHCGPGILTITVNGTGNIRWYSDPGLTNLVDTGHSFTTPLLTTTTTYYLTASDSNCTSPVIRVVARIDAIPDTPTLTGGSRCGLGTVTLTGTGCTGGTLRWYNKAVGGSLVGTGPSFTTPILKSTATYYVACRIGSCESARVPVVANVNNVIALNRTHCGPGRIVLTASGPGIINWYSDSTLTNLVGTGTKFITPLLTQTTTYYITSTTDYCTSPVVAISAIIGSIPNLVITNPADACAPHSVDLTAPAITAGSTLDSGTKLTYWTNSTATTPLVRPDSVTQTGIYYIKATTPGGCSVIKPVVVTINECKPPCGYDLVLESRNYSYGYTTFIWSVQNPNPGNGLNGTIQDLSHWGFILPRCVNVNDIVKISSSGNNCSSWDDYSADCHVDPSQDCITSPVIKFDYGTNGSTKSYYKLVLKGNYGIASDTGYFKSGVRTGCCTTIFDGVGCPSSSTDCNPRVTCTPNPYGSNIHFTFQCDITTNCSLEVYNIFGIKLKTLYQGSCTGGQAQSCDYSVPSNLRFDLIYVFRAGNQVIGGKILHTNN